MTNGSIGKRNLRQVIICLLLTFVLTGCGDDSPTKPQQPKDYIVYAYMPNATKNIFAYHTATGAIDSFAIPATAVWAMTASADGKLLYVGEDDSTSVVSVETRTVIKRLPKAWDKIVCSPDNRWAAIIGLPSYIFRTSDYQLVFADSVSGMWDGAFTKDGKHFYGSVGALQGKLCHVSLGDTLGVEYIEVVPMASAKILLSTDEQTLYFFSGTQFNLESIELSTRLVTSFPIGGCYCISMASSRDGSRLYLTIGETFDCRGISDTYQVYDIVGSQLRSVKLLADCNQFGWEAGGEMAITPDARLIVASQDNSMVYAREWHDLILIYPDFADSTRVICVPRQKRFMTCQAGL